MIQIGIFLIIQSQKNQDTFGNTCCKFVIFAHCLQLVFLFLTKRNYILRMTSHKKLLFGK